ncbi:hypothetical protein [Adhaeribacter radiodurans]|uniref:Uncharacterized protein n=1 Tax=Adhaeribacter radiodurans TaxID=2745197 RepID=A0A7L7L1C4_9BACT|nr:hypothetical protein [Adhaeribacter radiodurans]QMU26593.1 hypothetical protein HUW48_00535 [Adhaeribacter radiodurans]
MFESVTYQKKDKSYLEERYMLLCFIFFGIVVIFYILELRSIYSIIPFITSIIFYWKWHYFKQGQERLDGRFQKQLKLCKTSIQVGETVFTLNEITDIRIDIKHLFGEEVISTSTITYKNGTDNNLEFTYNNVKYQFAFWIKSEQHKEDLKRILKEWYLAKVRFEETSKGNTSYLLEV